MVQSRTLSQSSIRYSRPTIAHNAQASPNQITMSSVRPLDPNSTPKTPGERQPIEHVTQLHAVPNVDSKIPPPPPPPPPSSRGGRKILGSLLFVGGSLVFLAYYQDSRSAIHEYVVTPLIRQLLDAEQSHKVAVKFLSMRDWATKLISPRDKGTDGDELKVKIWDLELSNPVGLAAGFDKDAQAIDGLFDLGFGYVEVGSITPEPQPGNPKPRFFRLEEDGACINRYGFNSLGHRYALHQLQSRIRDFAVGHPSLFPNPLPLNPMPPAGLPRSLRPGKLLAVNLGKNKTSAADSNEDYISGVRMLGPYADVLVINVSSPNTPGLRGLQGKDFLGRLLSEVVEERNKLPVEESMKPKVVVKVAPDLDEHELEDIATAIRMSAVDGVIVSNTTIKRDGLGLKSQNAREVGGLSGKPVKPLSLLALASLRALLPPSTPIIGCGGITNGKDAMEFVNAGATFVQGYTGFGYAGVGYPCKIKDQIADELHREGTSWQALVSKNSDRWQEGLKQVKEELESEAEKLKEIRATPSSLPVEDKASNAGQASRLLTADEMSRMLSDSLAEAPASQQSVTEAPSTINLPSSPVSQVSHEDFAEPTGATSNALPPSDTLVKAAGVIALAALSRRPFAIPRAASAAARRSNQTARHFTQFARRRAAPATRFQSIRRSFATSTAAGAAQSTSMSAKLKLLFKKYGKTAIGVYLLFSGIDLSIAYVLVHLAGADQIEKGQDWVTQKYHQITNTKDGAAEPSLAEHAQVIAQEGYDHTKEVAQTIMQNVTGEAAPARSNKHLFWAEFALAYGIHKTLFLPIRVGLTASLTPRISKWLTRKGWMVSLIEDVTASSQFSMPY